MEDDPLGLIVSLRRDFTADRQNARWVGDMTEIPTAGGKLYLATVIDLYSRRLLGAATGLHPHAELACAAIKMAVAARGGVDAVNQPGWEKVTVSPLPGAISSPRGHRQVGSRSS